MYGATVSFNMSVQNHPSSCTMYIVTCLRLLTTSEHQMLLARVLETLFGLLLWFYYDFASRHYNFFYNVRSSLPC
jgi:hypothetical protein